MPARYRVLSWSVLVVRMLVVVAIAVLSGAVIGGVGIYLINDGSTGEPLSTGTQTSRLPIVTSGARPPVQTAAEPPTSAPTAQNKPAADPASPPLALAPVQLSDSQSTATAQPESSPDNVSPSTAVADQKPATQAATSDQIKSTRKAALGKKRFTGRRRAATEASAGPASGEWRPVYDYYNRDNSDRRYGWRDDQDRSAGRARRQPTQSLFGGFFGDNH